jgi:hypothetical protein
MTKFKLLFLLFIIHGFAKNSFGNQEKCQPVGRQRLKSKKYCIYSLHSVKAFGAKQLRTGKFNIITLSLMPIFHVSHLWSRSYETALKRPHR